MFGARRPFANIESVVPKQLRLSDVLATVGQRDCADSGCGLGGMDCRSRDSTLILLGLQLRSRCCPGWPSRDRAPSSEVFEGGEIETQLARSENSANHHAVPNLRAQYNLHLHALCGRAQFSVEKSYQPGSILSGNQQDGSGSPFKRQKDSPPRSDEREKPIQAHIVAQPV